MVLIQVAYPGSSARIVADTVAAPIEQQVNGVEKARWLWSRSKYDGKYSLRVAFVERTDRDLAEVLVQNRVALAVPMLPDAANRAGITVCFDAPPVRILVLRSTNVRYDAQYVGNLASLKLVRQLQRVPSVGGVELAGKTELVVHVYGDPEKLSVRGLTILDLRDQLKLELADQPSNANGDIDVLRQIVLRTTPDGNVIRLRDVARVELGVGKAQDFALLDGKPAVAMVIRPVVDSLTVAGETDLRRQVTTIRSQLPTSVSFGEFFACDPRGDAKAPASDYWGIEVTFPSDATPEQIAQSLSKVEADLRQIPGVKATLALSENPFAAFRDGPCVLIQFDDARGDRRRITEDVRRRLKNVQDFTVCIRNLSPKSPENERLEMALVAKADPGPDDMRRHTDELVRRLRKYKELVDISHEAAAESPSIVFNIDRTATNRLGVSLADINDTLQAYGGIDVGSFRRLEQSLPVKVELDVPGTQPFEKIPSLKVRTVNGQLVAFNEIGKMGKGSQPSRIERFNLHPMVRVNATPAEGVSHAKAWEICKRVASELDKEFRLGEAYRLERLSLRPERVSRQSGRLD